jgi:HlyD family secretion protein
VRLAIVFAYASLLAVGAACRDDDPNVVEGIGTLEVVEVDVAPLTPARVVRVWRQEGESVRAGDTLVSLTQSTVRGDLDARRARLRTAEAQLSEALAGARPAEIARAEADLRGAESEATRTAEDLARVNALVQSGTVSRQQLDAARGAATAAEARRDAARNALRLLREGTRPERIAAARAEVQNAQAALASAEQTASDLVLVAPVSGTVMLRNAEPGEVLGTGFAAMTIGDLARPFVRIYVNQSAVTRVRLGARAEGALDAQPESRYSGRVIAINHRAEFTPRVALTEDERADLLFGIKVAFDDSTGVLKPGLPITVRIPTSTDGQ